MNSFFSAIILRTGERYDFVINADQPVGAYWIQARGLGECGIRRVQQLGILRYARGPYQPTTNSPSYDVGLPQGVVSISIYIIGIHKTIEQKKVKTNNKKLQIFHNTNFLRLTYIQI